MAIQIMGIGSPANIFNKHLINLFNSVIFAPKIKKRQERYGRRHVDQNQISPRP